ncbi:MAG: hypothetical protein PUE71_00690 [Clostridia bacterium]|nr:hypothetical protein [Clostridia bacterium]
MQEKEKYMPEGNNDMERLMYAMNQLKNRNFQAIDGSAFEDGSVADTYNEMLDSIMEYNNHFLMRINDAMTRIADNSNVKDMLTQINSQKEPIENMREANETLSLQLRQNETQLVETLAMSKQIDNTIMPCVKKMTESEMALENSIKEIDEVLSQKTVKKQDMLRICENARKQEAQALTRSKEITERVAGLGEQAKIIRKNVGEICLGDNEKVNVFKSFAEGLKCLTDNYGNLSRYCFGVGSQLYRISRDIDNARNDMFRHNSRPSMLDRLSVFYVDHLTLTWRLYLNVIEYETLKITQLNNPDRCKFGLWCANMTDPQIRDTDEFHEAFDAHEELHKHAVACFLAKEASDVSEALKEFDIALKVCRRFEEALNSLSLYLRSIGITEETEVWKFQG